MAFLFFKGQCKVGGPKHLGVGGGGRDRQRTIRDEQQRQYPKIETNGDSASEPYAPPVVTRTGDVGVMCYMAAYANV